ncbi:LCP family protein [Streptomyces sp. NPDC048664]|uniref:LCP family protein n=1 Tax=Streptomyces sp. NPDC048664 TaxID=3154505 RepID=UPI003437192D
MPTPPRAPARPHPSRRSPARRHPARRRRPRWAARMLTALSVSVLAAAGIGHAVIAGVDADISRIDPFRDMKDRPAGGHGMNILLVGTDGRDGVTEQERHAFHLGGAPCHCTDTVMIVHISADRERASVVSLPRDSYAQAPAFTDRATGVRHPAQALRLNAAYAEGGPGLTVRTVEAMTQLKIDHYMEVDFVSFMKTVDALGGVRVCTATPLKDGYTGLDLAPGTHLLNGGQALQYVRSRHVDAASDMSRMQRQQRFLAALIDRATSSGVLLNPIRFREVTGAVLGSVRADPDFGANELLDLSRAMRTFSPRSSEFTTVPLADTTFHVDGLGSTVKWDDARARALFRSLRDDRPLTPAAPRHRAKAPAPAVVAVPPQQIRVQVQNGTPESGLGKRVDDQLAATGFRTTGQPADAADRSTRHTVILYDPRWDRSARSLAAALPGSELRPAPGQGELLKVVAGSDFTQVHPVRADQPQKPDEVTTGDQVVCP